MNQHDAAARCRSCLRHENPLRLSVHSDRHRLDMIPPHGRQWIADGKRPRTGQLCAFGNRRTRRLGIDRGLPSVNSLPVSMN
jgi:hypothetical protein